MAFHSLCSVSNFRVSDLMIRNHSKVNALLKNYPISSPVTSNLKINGSSILHFRNLSFLTAARNSCPNYKKSPKRKLFLTRCQKGIATDSRNSGLGGEGEGEGGNLFLPLENLRDAKIIYAAAPALGHNQEGHPESNQRVPEILKALQLSRLTSQDRGREVVQLEGFSPATPKQVEAVHSSTYIRGLERAMQKAEDEGLIFLESSGPTYATSSTYNECMFGAGAGLAVVDSVVAASKISAGSSPAGFALVRPPGHHAVPTGPMGFCLIDHIAVAAKYAQIQHQLKRVMIVDFDVHHGNGTHDIFFEDPDVFFLSTHQAGSYPGTGKMEEVGEGEGEGSTLNLPLPGGSGDEAMAMVMEEVMAPAIQRFKPDIILVSAGYDAHFLDPLAGLQFTTGTYHRLTTSLQELAKQFCGGRIVFFLEGGYDLKSLSNSVSDTFRAFLGLPSISLKVDNPALLYDEPSLIVRSSVDKIRSIHSL